jgi:hypothetical protein
MTVSEKKIAHFLGRLADRNGITLSAQAFYRFCKARNKKNSAIQLSCRLGVHKVDLGGTMIAVLWDRKHNVPVTTLKDNSVIYGENQSYKWDGVRIISIPGKKRG